MITQEQIAIASIDYGERKPEGIRQGWAALDFLSGANWALKEAKVAELEAEITELVEMLQGVLAKSPAGSQYPHWSDFRAEIAQKLKKYEQSA